MNELSGIFRSSVRCDWTDRRILIGWGYGRAIDANAAGEIQISTIDRLRIRADVVRTSQIGIEVLDRIMPGLSVYGCKIDHPTRGPTGQVRRDRLPYVRRGDSYTGLSQQGGWAYVRDVDRGEVARSKKKSREMGPDEAGPAKDYA